MDFELSAKTKELQQRLRIFMDAHVYPNERRFHEELERERWKPTRIVEDLKSKAHSEGVWNTRHCAKSWAAVTWRPRCSIVRHQTRGIWRCWRVMARGSRRNNG